MRRPLSRAAAAAAAAMLLAGCSSTPDPSEDPRALLDDAISDVMGWEGLTATVRLDFDPDQLAELDDSMTDDDVRAANVLASSSVTVHTHPGADADDPADNVFGMAFTIGDLDDAVAFRAIDETFYIRADVAGLADTFDAPEGQLEQAHAMLDELDVDGDAVLGGQWVQLDGVKQLMSMAEGMSAEQGAGDIDMSALADAATSSLTDLYSDTDVTYVGEGDAGHHLRVTATGEQTVDAFEPALEAYADLVAEQAGALGGPASTPDADTLLDELRSSPDYDEFAASTLPVDVWVADGTITQVGFDLAALVELNPDLADGGDADELADLDRMAIVAEVADFDGDLQAPAAPTVIDLFAVFGKAMSGGLGGPGMPDSDVSPGFDTAGQ